MPGRIMIVDDERPLRALVKQFLTPLDHTFSEVEDLASLKKEFTNPAPEVLLLDLHLPDGNGLSVISDIKKAWPTTRIVILTGFGSVQEAEQAYELDDVFLLSKPFDAEMLRAIIDMARLTTPRKKG